MGVKGLWRLLLPIGRRISIETLEGQILAIDASIWLTQFLTVAARQREQDLLDDGSNGHSRSSSTTTTTTTSRIIIHTKAYSYDYLVGFLRRLCKLRYQGVRPVLVFDGATPEIKRRELLERAKRRKRKLGEAFLGPLGRTGDGNGNGNGNGDGEDDDYDGAVPALICTDLASRGLDVPGVTAVVQLQFSGNVVSHLHRMGRCGRAGQRTGRGIVFYDEQEAELVEVVQEAEAQQERMQLEGQEVDDRLNDDDDDGDSAEDKAARKGKVQKAFSRKRGFTKKRKKLRREETESY